MNKVQIKQLTRGFVDYDNLGMKAGSFGPYDKGRLATFAIQQNGTQDSVQARFFISFLQRMANATVVLDEGKLLKEAKKLLKNYGTKITKKDMFFVYNFSTREFQLLN